MKKFCIFCACLALAGFVSCQKQQTEEERKAEIDRQVEQRLATERQAQEQQQLAQREADLSAREKALAEKQNAAATQTQSARSTSAKRTTRDGSEDEGSYNIFYTKLEPYGEWREVSAYGYVWQPRDAERSRNWRPYTNGRWVYTDVGWMWISDEPFGWATYHYGRWTRLRNVGWVWVPGDEWSPAWVSWRKSDEYVGWAPLPPEARFDRRRGIHNWADNYYDIGPDQYCFVPTRELGAQRIESTVVPRERNITIINQTTNVTNITYNNTTVVNQGPNYDELRARSQQPIERLRLERQVNVDLSVEVAQPVVRGEVIAVPAPMIAVGRPAQRPRTLKAAIAQAVVEHGWEEIADRRAAEQARTKMKSESTPPPDAPSKTFVKPAVTETLASTASATPAEGASAIASATPTATTTPPPIRVQRTETPPASASPSSTEVPSAIPPSTPKQTAPPKLSESAAPSPSVAMTPARRIKPLPIATSTPSPIAAATETMTPRQRPTPPGAIASPIQNVSPNAAPENSRELRSQEQLREMRGAPASRLPSPSATSTSSPVSTPVFSPPARSTTLRELPSPSMTPSNITDGSPSPTPAAKPTASPTPKGSTAPE
jgi:hypothetical protein